MDGLVALAGVGIGFSAVLAAVLIGIAKLTGGSPDA